MLVIRQEQMDALIKGSDEEWVEFLVGQVKKEDPEIATKYKDDALRSMVRTGIEKSNKYGFSAAKEQSAFVSIMFTVAPNFDEQPEIKAVLDDERFQPSQRIENLWSPSVPDPVWDKAKESYDERAWHLDGEGRAQQTK